MADPAKGAIFLLRAAFYARVSTDEQVEGYSISAQLKALEDYASRNAWEVVAQYVDEGESARTDNRPQFQLMVSAAKRKPRPFDVVLVHKFDRFARNREDSSIYKSLFRRECGIDVRSVTELTDNSPTGKLLEGVLEVVAEFYSNNLAHEVLKGQRQRALEAKALSLPPIGYLIGPDGTYSVDPNTVEIVRWVFQEYSTGVEGYRSLAQRIQADGEARFGPSVRNYSWTDAFVRRILTNEAYCGTYIWGRRDSNKKWAERDRSEWVVIEQAHEPIVTSELFAKVQALRSSRHGVRRASPGEDYLLRGLIRCLDCGATGIKFRYQWDDRKTGDRKVLPSLICSAYSKGKGCYCNRVSMAEVESQVFDYLRYLLGGRLDPEKVVIKPPSSNVAHRESAHIDKRIETLDRKLERLVDAYAAEIIGVDELKSGRERIMAERSLLDLQRSQNNANSRTDPEELVAKVKSCVRSVMSTAREDSLPMPQRRAALETIIESVHFSRKQELIHITFRLSS